MDRLGIGGHRSPCAGSSAQAGPIVAHKLIIDIAVQRAKLTSDRSVSTGRDVLIQPRVERALARQTSNWEVAARLASGGEGPVRRVRAGEVELAYRLWPGEGPAIVAIHGLTASHVSFAGIAERLAGRRPFFAPDLRGRGRSDKPATGYGMRQHALDVAAAMRGLGLGRSVVLGHSMGAYVGTALAVEFPALVAGLVMLDGGYLLDPPAGLDPDQLLDTLLKPQIERLRTTYESMDRYLAFWRALPTFPAKDWGPWVEDYLEYDLGGEPPEVVLEVVLHPGAPILGGKSRQSSPEGEVSVHGLVRRAQALDLGLEQRVEELVGIQARGRVEQVAAVEHHQSGDKSRELDGERGPDVRAHRMAEYNAAPQSEAAHRGRHIECVLPHAISGRRLVRPTAAAEVRGEERTPPSEPLRDVGKADVRSGETVDGDDGRSFARPQPVCELHLARAHAPYRSFAA